MLKTTFLFEMYKFLLKSASECQLAHCFVGLCSPVACCLSSLTPFLSSQCNLHLVQTFLLHETAVKEKTKLHISIMGQCDWHVSLPITYVYGNNDSGVVGSLSAISAVSL